ncbi:MAG: alpha/beta fold hydrolase [Candidatus Hydrogenedentes bacterium]|nr:alpha/beta fold hydrolase [Candidatus Hydrogenedentota bacterium]
MRIDWHYQARGEHSLPAVVFLHGFMGSAGDWEDIIAPLSDEFYCVAVDLPGHGRTRVDDPAGISMESAAASLIDLVDELNLDHFSVAGYSMGGRLALYWSTIASMRIDRRSPRPAARDGRLQSVSRRAVCPAHVRLAGGAARPAQPGNCEPAPERPLPIGPGPARSRHGCSTFVVA